MSRQAQVWLGLAWKLAVLALVIAAFFWANRALPAEHLPWKTFDPDRPIGHASATQLLRVSLSPTATCERLADASLSLASTPSAPRDGDADCGWEVARLVTAIDQIELAGASNLQCPMALGITAWLRETDRLARDHLGQGLARIHHFGSYSCRRMYGRSTGAWSEHAFANAWDVASFELDDGRLISVLRDWDGEPAKRRFLRDTRDAACKLFRVTLSPDYNAAHSDHFHIDMGPSRSCR